MPEYWDVSETDMANDGAGVAGCGAVLYCRSKYAPGVELECHCPTVLDAIEVMRDHRRSWGTGYVYDIDSLEFQASERVVELW